MMPAANRAESLLLESSKRSWGSPSFGNFHKSLLMKEIEDPIIIDDDDGSSTSQMPTAWHKEQCTKQRSPIRPIGTTVPRPRTTKLTLEQLRAYDDVLTDYLIDQVSCQLCTVHRHLTYMQIYNFKTQKFNKSYQAICQDQQSLLSILGNVLIKQKDLVEAGRLQLDLPRMKTFLASLGTAEEEAAFKRHMKRYLEIYLPNCPFELSTTHRYTLTTPEAAIISRQFICKGAEIKYLCGVRAVLTQHEEDELDASHNNFSIVYTTRNQASSLLGGSGRFANNDCNANARLVSFGVSGVQIIAVKDIEIGEEITVWYANGYFGERNCDCLCKSCERGSRNGWAHGSRIAGDYPNESLHPGNHIQGHGASCSACKRHEQLYGFCWPKTRSQKY